MPRTNRFVEVPASNEREREREKQGWTVIKDRATGNSLVIMANDREGALWVIRALNAADRTEDRLSAPSRRRQSSTVTRSQRQKDAVH